MASDSSAQVELAQYSHNHPSAAVPTDVQLLPSGTHSPSDSNEGFSLPPTDTGKDAWLFLFACFMLEALIWGTSRTGASNDIHLTTSLSKTMIPSPDITVMASRATQLTHTGFPASYGIFQEYYTNNEPFVGSGSLAIVGACAMVKYQEPPEAIMTAHTARV
jgi:hypothetical protein